MIRQVMREEWRASARAQIWTGALLMVALTLLSVAFTTASTQVRLEREVGELWAPSTEHRAFVQWWTHGEPESPSPSALQNAVAPGAVETTVDQLRAACHHAEARIVRYVQIAPVGEAAQDGHGIAPSDHPWFALADYPAPEWNSLLVEGQPPATGEVVLRRDLAVGLGYSVGDVALVRDGWRQPHPPAQEMRISGFSAPAAESPFTSRPPEVLMTWEDGLAFAQDATHARGELRDGNTTVLVSAEVGWDGDPAAIPGAESWEVDFQWATDIDLLWPALEGTAAVMVAAALAALAVVIAAFGMARAQAQARASWTGTLRALGATRRHVATATVANALLTGLLASAVGVGLGYGIVAAMLGWQRSQEPDAWLLSAPAITWPGAVLVVVCGLVVAAIMSIAPAFWASRVPPATALKPVPPIDHDHVSRTVSPRWLVWMAGAFLAVLAVAAVGLAQTRIGPVVLMGSAAALTILAVAGVTELARIVVLRLAVRLQRSSRPWSVAAGAAVSARRQQAAVAAAVMGWTVALGAAVTTLALTPDPGAGGDLDPVIGSVTGTVALAAIVGLAIIAAGRAAGAAETALQAALGLGPADARRSAAVQTGLPLLTGAVLGTVMGGALGAVYTVVGLALDASTAGVRGVVFSPLMVAAAVGLVGAACALISGALTGALTRSPVPAHRRD